MKRDWKLIRLFATLFLLGLALIVCSRLQALEHTLAAELLRDLGIAFCVSVVIARVIEVNLSRDTYLRGLDAIMERTVPNDVWQEFRQHVITQSLMREDWSVTMNLAKSPSGSYVSTTTVQYTIVALEALQTKVSHGLDSHRTPTGTSTRFTSARIGDHHYPDHTALQNAGLVSTDELTLTLPIALNKFEEKVAIELVFDEEIKCPDTLSWWMFRVTRNVTLKLDGLPADWIAEVVTFHPAPKQLVQATKTEWRFSGIMLPGQGIELHVRR